jgi:4,5-dihydroxyphthalate decarboxylase
LADRLPITYGGFTYLDRTWPLQTGLVQPRGVELNYAAIAEIGALFRRMAQFAEFEASEMSLSTLMVMAGQGHDRLVGLPVFPSRSFRHAFIFVGDDSGITKPKDLIGKRVGVQDYQATAYLWIRAVLEHEFGVSPRDVTWHVGGLDILSPQHRLRHAPPPGVTIELLPPDATLENWLREGRLDAVMTPEELISTSPEPANWHRLFPNHLDREREYYTRTGFFPIMHCVVVRRDVYEAHRWIAVSLLDAFERAKQIGYARMRDLTAPALTIPGIGSALDELDEVFGGDAFPYGFEKNFKILDAMTQYSVEQGLTSRKLDPGELFASETLTHIPEGL